MVDSCSIESLNYWRKFFSCANADIFHVIKFAILVASADCPSEFLSWRDQITEVLYNCYSMQQCFSEEEDTQKESKESKSSDSSEENEHTISNGQSSSGRVEHSNLDEYEALTNEIEEAQETFGEVLRIKELLTNWADEPEKIITDSLRRLQLMELTIETLSATQIGKTVSGLNKHKSKPVRQLARTLVKDWKLLAEQWVTATLATQEPSPFSVDPSPAQEESLLPSELDFPPLDMGALLATQTGSFEFSKIFEGIDDDGNLAGNVRKNMTPKQVDDDSTRSGNGGNQKEVAARHVAEPLEATTYRAPKHERSPYRAPKHERSPLQKSTICRNSDQRQTPQQYSGELRKKQVPAPKATSTSDANHKASNPRDNSNKFVHERLPTQVDVSKFAKQRQNSSVMALKNGSSSRNISKESEDQAYQAKLEVAKRKLQDRYEEANNAKRQRTIQVMELKDLPKQVQNKAQPMMKRGSQFRRCMNMKS